MSRLASILLAGLNQGADNVNSAFSLANNRDLSLQNLLHDHEQIDQGWDRNDIAWDRNAYDWQQMQRDAQLDPYRMAGYERDAQRWDQEQATRADLQRGGMLQYAAGLPELMSNDPETLFPAMEQVQRFASMQPESQQSYFEHQGRVKRDQEIRGFIQSVSDAGHVDEARRMAIEYMTTGKVSGTKYAASDPFDFQSYQDEILNDPNFDDDTKDKLVSLAMVTRKRPSPSQVLTLFGQQNAEQSRFARVERATRNLQVLNNPAASPADRARAAAELRADNYPVGMPEANISGRQRGFTGDSTVVQGPMVDGKPTAFRVPKGGGQVITPDIAALIRQRAEEAVGAPEGQGFWESMVSYQRRLQEHAAAVDEVQRQFQAAAGWMDAPAGRSGAPAQPPAGGGSSLDAALDAMSPDEIRQLIWGQ
jgi:hypothetical protein